MTIPGDCFSVNPKDAPARPNVLRMKKNMFSAGSTQKHIFSTPLYYHADTNDDNLEGSNQTQDPGTLLVAFLTCAARTSFAHSTPFTNAADTTSAPAGLVCVWSFG